MNKDIQEIVQNWVALSDYDYESAGIMLENGRYLYVGFMCQQSIEKVLKAIYVKEKEKTPPYTHNLKRLVSEISFFSEVTQEQFEQIENINSYYIESRYAEDIREISKELDDVQMKQAYEQTRKLVSWLKARI